MARILLVDDDKGIVEVLSMVLQTNNYDVIEMWDSNLAKETMLKEKFDLLISDLRMEPVSGMDLLVLAHDKYPGMPVLMLTGNATLATATEALKLGAFDYILKPFKVDDLLTTVQRALDYGSKASSEISTSVRVTNELQYQYGKIIAESDSMREVCDMIKKVVPVDTPVLIYGERGTGKQMVARVIHENGTRKDKNFVCVNLDAIPGSEMALSMFQLDYEATIASDFANQGGVFSDVNEGTIMFKKIGSMPSKLQKDILKVLQGQEVDGTDGKRRNINVRIIVTSDFSMEKMVEEGRLRQDLASKLGAITIELKPLRERVKDIFPLTCHFIRQVNNNVTNLPEMDAEVKAVLESYSWPGNLTELKNTVCYFMENLSNGRITRASLPSEIAMIDIMPESKGSVSKGEEFKAKSLKEFIRKKASDNLKSGLASLRDSLRQQGT